MSEENQIEQIDKELIKQSLYNLGKTFNNARHAYLSLNLSNNSLTTLNVSKSSVHNNHLVGASAIHLLISNWLVM